MMPQHSSARVVPLCVANVPHCLDNYCGQRMHPDNATWGNGPYRQRPPLGDNGATHPYRTVRVGGVVLMSQSNQCCCGLVGWDERSGANIRQHLEDISEEWRLRAAQRVDVWVEVDSMGNAGNLLLAGHAPKRLIDGVPWQSKRQALRTPDAPTAGPPDACQHLRFGRFGLLRRICGDMHE